MEIEVTGTDEYGNEAYRTLLDTIMNDVGKAQIIEKVKLVLEPEIPMFIFSLKLVNEPGIKTIADAADFRSEGSELHMSISDERYAPQILSLLWKRYGRANVDQQTRFDILVHGGDEKEVSEMVVDTGEETKKEVIGALWRVLPEGIKARHNISEGSVITILATEEIVKPEMKEEAQRVHDSMKGAV
ncbi:MAG: methanogenesis marker 17 protein [Candidatus Methanomethylophilaceae archaeon]